MHKSSMRLMADFRDRCLGGMAGCTVLDVGALRLPNHDCYRTLFRDYQYIGMDVTPGDNVDVVGYENLADTYDVVISGQVMEHIPRPWEWLARLAGLFRVYICIIAPNAWPEHRYPLDCYRFLPDGMRALFDYAGIMPVEIRKQGRDTIGIGSR
jgi:hypothetical protein